MSRKSVQRYIATVTLNIEFDEGVTHVAVQGMLKLLRTRSASYALQELLNQTHCLDMTVAGLKLEKRVLY